MALSYSLAPNPKWYIADMVGRPLAGGFLATFSSLDKTQLKPVYQTASADFPWPYIDVPNAGVLGIQFDENGSQGPFYWESNSLDPTDTYYIEVYDSNGVLQWTVDDFFPSGSGGGSTTTAVNLQNLITNPSFYRNLGTTSLTLPTFVVLAPGANAGIVGDTSLAATTGSPAPDITFIKSNTGATDQIIFTAFPPGISTLSPDATPVDFLRYTSNAGGAESFKCIQIPITSKVQNLSNMSCTTTFWGRLSGAGANQVTTYYRQFYGSGSSTLDQRVPINTYTLTGSWQKFHTTFTVPDASSAVISGCGNDALFFQIEFPLNLACDISLALPGMYFGSLVPDQQYITYDMIDAFTNTARTGDIRISLNSFYPYGWLLMNDTTIGNSSSNATNRANIDTFPLFYLLWTSFQANQTFAPMFTSASAPVAYGASASADFNANRQISLTKSAGRLIANIGTPSSGTNTGTNWAAGQTTGNELQTISIANMPAHDHTGSTVAISNAGGPTQSLIAPGSAPDSQGSHALAIASQGGGTAVNIQNPVSYFNVFIKL